MRDHIIRAAAENDGPELSRLLTALGHPTTAEGVQELWSQWAEAGNRAFVVAEPSGRLLGLVNLHRMVVLHRPKPVGRITALVVDPTIRGRGIGRSLVAAAESELYGAGCGLIEITSNNRLVDAHGFYEHLGYTRTSIRLAKDLSSFDKSPASLQNGPGYATHAPNQSAGSLVHDGRADTGRS